MEKRGISPIIATVLIILLIIVAGAFLAFYGIPVVKSLFGSEDCFNVLKDIDFESSGEFNCWVSDGETAGTVFAIKISNPEIEGFRVGLIYKGSSELVDVVNNTVTDKIRMFNDPSGAVPLEVNNNGGVRAYVANGVYDEVEIFPILKGGKVCREASKTLEPVECLNANTRNNILGDDDNQDNGDDEEPPAECIFGNAQWEDIDGNPIAQVIEGTRVYLNIYGTDCDGESASFLISENDNYGGLGGTINQPSNAVFSSGIARTSWVSQYHPDGTSGANDPPEYGFVSSLVGGGQTSTSALLNVTKIGAPVDMEQCVLTSAYWAYSDGTRRTGSGTTVSQGTQVHLVVEGENCLGKTVNFRIREDDGILGYDSANINPSNARFLATPNIVMVPWNAEWQCDGQAAGICILGNPEYYFNVSITTNSSITLESSKVLAEELKVTEASPTCGNGIVQTGEQCDDGNLNTGDGCSGCNVDSGWSCSGEPSVCSCSAGDSDGDGVSDCLDVCPNDNPDDPDGDGVCSSNDQCPNDFNDDSDGDNVCDSLDLCPGSNDNNDLDNDGLPDGCDSQTCGNVIPEPGEECDGNTQSCTIGGYPGTQTCSASCTWNSCTTNQFCGDGITNGNEVCDGNSRTCTTAGGYPGTQACTFACTGFGTCTSSQSCGDGICNGPETSTTCPQDCGGGSPVGSGDEEDGGISRPA